MALSSAESELYAMNAGAAEGLYVQGLLREAGMCYPLEVLCDSSAAVALTRRRGLGRARHLDVRELWIQDQIQKGAIKIRHVPGKTNPADALTKALAGASFAALEEIDFGCKA